MSIIFRVLLVPKNYSNRLKEGDCRIGPHQSIYCRTQQAACAAFTLQRSPQGQDEDEEVGLTLTNLCTRRVRNKPITAGF